MYYLAHTLPTLFRKQGERIRREEMTSNWYYCITRKYYCIFQICRFQERYLATLCHSHAVNFALIRVQSYSNAEQKCSLIF